MAASPDEPKPKIPPRQVRKALMIYAVSGAIIGLFAGCLGAGVDYSLYKWNLQVQGGQPPMNAARGLKQIVAVDALVGTFLGLMAGPCLAICTLAWSASKNPACAASIVASVVGTFELLMTMDAGAPIDVASRFVPLIAMLVLGALYGFLTTLLAQTLLRRFATSGLPLIHD
jgi:hypothetical protein